MAADVGGGGGGTQRSGALVAALGKLLPKRRVRAQAHVGRDHPHAHDESCMWRRPDPKKDFVLSIAFALQRGNANTLMAAASRRRDRRTKAVTDPTYYPSSSDDEIEA